MKVVIVNGAAKTGLNIFYIQSKNFMRKTTFIYALKDPRTNIIRYIGKANEPYKRYKKHLNKCRDKNTHKRNWINSLKSF